MGYLENSKINLFELSIEKDDFKKAIEEWEFSGEMEDYGTNIENCYLCENNGLRYHFEIINKINENTLMVGSSCIDKFDIAVFDENGIEVKENKDAHLKKRMRNKHVLDCLNQLENSKTNRIRRNKKHPGKKFFTKDLDINCIGDIFNGYMATPKQLLYLFGRFKEEGIKFTPNFFKTDIRSDYNKRQLLSFNEQQYEKIKKALSKNQKEYYKRNK